MLAALGAEVENIQYGLVAITDDGIVNTLGVEGLTSALDAPGLPDLGRFEENCGGCHNGTAQITAQRYFYRGTGCAACHVLYTDGGLYQGGDPTLSRTEPGHAATHQLTVAIPFTTCNHCHNRGVYDAVALTFSPRGFSTEGLLASQARAVRAVPGRLDSLRGLRVRAGLYRLPYGQRGDG